MSKYSKDNAYAREWRRLQALEEHFTVELNFPALHAILVALQISLTITEHDEANGDNVRELGKALQAYIDQRSPLLGQYYDQGWQPGLKLFGMEKHPLEEPPCSEPFSQN